MDWQHDTTGMTIEERLAALEDRKIKLADLPLATIKADFEQTWLPDAKTFLLPHSVTSELLMPVATVTALPVATAGSPILDGQEIYYVADATNGIVWHLKFRAASASAYKWEFVGGAMLMHDLQATGTETTGSTGYTDITTTGPTLTAPLAGDYMIDYGMQYFTDTAFAGNFSALWLGTASVVANSSCGGTPSNANEVHSAARSRSLFGLAASQEVRMRYLVTAGTGSFSKRWMRMTPIRVG